MIEAIDHVGLYYPIVATSVSTGYSRPALRRPCCIRAFTGSEQWPRIRSQPSTFPIACSWRMRQPRGIACRSRFEPNPYTDRKIPPCPKPSTTPCAKARNPTFAVQEDAALQTATQHRQEIFTALRIELAAHAAARSAICMRRSDARHGPDVFASCAVGTPRH